jgi:RNA polymerase sigma factor (sigma-70 family)
MEKQYDSLSNYISLAKKTISKFGPKFYNGLSLEMLQNEEAISDIATALMYADWRFDENRVGKTGLKKTKYSYRNQCALWAIKTYVTNKYKGRKHLSLDRTLGESSDDNGYDYTISGSQTPDNIIMKEEEETILSDTINSLLASDLLSEKQRQQIKMYYFDNYTLSKIGKHFGVSREAVRQNIKRGLDTIREYDIK